MLTRREFVRLAGLSGIAGLAGSAAVLASCSAAPPAVGEGAPIPLYAEDPADGAELSGEVAGEIKVAFAALVSPQESFYKYQNLVAYLEAELGQSIGVVRRQTYREVNELLGSGEVDFGFICSLSYVMGLDAGTLEGVAVPIVNGRNYYQGYVISRTDSGLSTLEDLEGTTFAFTDPFSYTGRLSMLKLLHDKAGADEGYFKDVFYTYSHDSSIQAVHLGIADAASVDSLVYDELARAGSDIVANTSIIYEGPFAGMPPVVSSRATDASLRRRFQDTLLGMDGSEQGRAVLAELGYDRFEVPDDAGYEVIREALRAVGPEVLDEDAAAASAGSS